MSGKVLTIIIAAALAAGAIYAAVSSATGGNEEPNAGGSAETVSTGDAAASGDAGGDATGAAESSPQGTGGGGMQGVGFEVMITPEQAAALIEDALAEDFPVSNVELTFNEDNTIAFKGDVSRNTISKAVSESGIKLSGLVNAALFLLPDPLRVEVALSVAVDEKTAQPEFTINAIKIENFSIDPALIPQSALEEIDKAVADAVSSYNGRITSIEVKDGVLHIKGEFR